MVLKAISQGCGVRATLMLYLYPPDRIRWILWILPPSLQCVERFHHYNEKNIIASLRKFAGYIHNHKILPGNIFGPILKNMMPAMGLSLSVMKSAYISLIIGPRAWDGKPTYRKSWIGNLLVLSDLTLDPPSRSNEDNQTLKCL